MISFFLAKFIEISAALGIYPGERKMIFQNTAQVLIEGFGRVNVEERVVLCSSYASPRHPPALPERRKSAKIRTGSAVHMGNLGLISRIEGG